MISPQEPGSTYYYPQAGTTRVSYTHPSVTAHYWRNKIADEIQAKCASGNEWSCGTDGFTAAGHCTCEEAARIARGEK